MSLGRVYAISEKEARYILRDPRSLAVTTLLPLVLLVLFGYAINFDVREISLAVFDPDSTPVSRDLVQALTRTEYFRLVRMLPDVNDAEHALASGQAKAVVVIPTGFGADLAAGRTVSVQSLINGSDSLTASIALGYLEGMLQDWSLRYMKTQLPRDSVQIPITPKVRIWFNEDLSSVLFITPGLIVVILIMLAALLTSQTIVRERERGTMEGLIVSPITAREILLGKLLPYVVIALADVVLVAAAGRLLFDVPLRGNPIILLALLLIYLLSALGLGLLISSIARSQQVAYLMALIGTLLPTILLTGFIFPVSSMPDALRAAVQLHPATHFMIIARSMSLKGASFGVVLPRALALLSITIGVIALTVSRFRKTL